MKVTREALQRAIDQMRAGGKLFDVCGAVQQHVEQNGFSVVREFVGHGIGTKLHEEPHVPNYVDPKVKNPRLRQGVVLAVEPMVCAGTPGDPGVVGPLDRGHRGWLAGGAFRALCCGDRKRSLDFDGTLAPRWRTMRSSGEA